jgi:hypothetical protein
MVIIQRVALEHRSLFLLQLYCSVSSHNAMTVLISTKGFESVNAVPEDYGEADSGITLARSTLTFSLTVIARSPCDEAIQGPRAVAPGLLRCARNDGGVDATIIGHRLSTGKPSLWGQGRKIGERAAAGPWIAALAMTVEVRVALRLFAPSP